MVPPSTRREALGAIAGVGAAGLAGCSDVFANDPTEDPKRFEGWPSYRYDAANSGRNPDATGPKGDLEVAWRQDLESPDDGSLSDYSCPIVLGERVIVAFDFDLGTSRETRVIAVDRETGERDWSETFELAPDGSNEKVAMPSRTLESDGVAVYLVTLDGGPTLRALDPETGDERWNASLERQLYSPPTADGDSLYAGERTYAVLDADDGDLERRYEWEKDGSVQASAGTFAPTITEDVFYAGVAGTLRATDRTDGSLLWSAESPFDSMTDDGGVSFNPPVVGDDVVYAVAGDAVRSDTGGGIVPSRRPTAISCGRFCRTGTGPIPKEGVRPRPGRDSPDCRWRSKSWTRSASPVRKEASGRSSDLRPMTGPSAGIVRVSEDLSQSLRTASSTRPVKRESPRSIPLTDR